ncbi:MULTISPECIES: HD domain-containing protein [unclassified Streptomyces]|uniref:HD domain-containing protein n=1 Tax=unclassified Streptomyces TaxID=2593676 RepID=UPI0022539790|nr:HD domain-containing protein [Streptomyces sp. NBC_01500]MCX4550015.1 HD domain-containing protein [Streptomyces sp. NBC_01500]WSV55480.1 HD domain-containing protein [Streptomyces sp. NBC_01014]
MEKWARAAAEAELCDALPRRWAHSQGVARRAAEVAGVLGDDAELLTSAAVLHDVGYAPRLARTEFHPLDGARFLRDTHAADDRLVRLVANHSLALLEAEERGLRDVLEAEFPLLDDQRLVDALVYCDMTTTPDGEVAFEFDTWPDLPTFVEIEGPDEASVRQAAALLELDYTEARFGSVDEIYKSESGRDILAESTLLFADVHEKGQAEVAAQGE